MLDDILNNLVALIIFIVPGAIIELAYKKFFPTSKKDVEGYEKTVKAIIYSLGVLLINLLAIKFIKHNEISSIKTLGDKLDSITFLFKYIGLSVASSIVIIFIDRLILKKTFLVLANLINKLNGKTLEVDELTAWEYLFETKEIVSQCVCMEKGGQVIARGFIKAYSPPQNENKEILLEYTDWVEKQMEIDKNKSNDDKMFYKCDSEYYDLQTDTLIKFYNMDKYHTYCEKIKSTS